MSGPRPQFIEVPPPLLREIGAAAGVAAHDATGDTPTLYHHPNWPMRKVFWLRLRFAFALVRRFAPRDGHACDFGGGGGVFLPTLSGWFAHVSCIDRELSAARGIVERLGLERVELYERDLLDAGVADGSFQCIVAADVLEHFAELSPPVDVLRRWLAPGGVLITSLPTENLCYVLLRKLFGVTRPPDHYHTAAEVEAFLAARGFRRLATRYVPLAVRVAPLFRVTAWRADAR